jgi:hypothetical protein
MKRRIFTIIAVALMLLSLIFSMTACDGGSTDDPIKGGGEHIQGGGYVEPENTEPFRFDETDGGYMLVEFFPENYSVANALGAIMGSVSATCSIEVKPITDPDVEPGYIAYAPGGNAMFKDLSAALTFAAEQATSYAREEALRRGAKGEITISTQTHVNEAKARTAMVYLGTIVTAHASGSMGF